jgi:hypothetical protein
VSRSGPMRSCWRRRVSSGGSSTCDCRGDRLHRRPQGPVRGRADLPDAEQAWRPDRPVCLLRRKGEAAVDAGGPRRPTRHRWNGPRRARPSGGYGRSRPNCTVGPVRIQVAGTAAPTERGAASGTVSAFLDLGLGGGPILLGLVAEALGIPWAFGVAAAVALAGCLWTIGLALVWSRQALAR